MPHTCAADMRRVFPECAPGAPSLLHRAPDVLTRVKGSQSFW